ncbi:MAG: hypothetical protein RLY34_1003, partial [Actinomycetota bacterium]
GGQEAGLRSGTENVAWAVALSTALDALQPAETESDRVCLLREEFIGAVLKSVPKAKLTGHPTKRLASIASFTIEGVSGEAVLLELERRGVVVSSGSACAAGSDEPSHVLLALGISAEVAQTSVRFSFSHQTTSEELQLAAIALAESVSVFI